MKRNGPLERRTPLRAKNVALRQGGVIPAQSKRTRQAEPQRREVREQVAERDQTCRAAFLVPSVACYGPLDVHEPKTRARGGNPLDPEACVLVCRRHHEWTHTNPASAAKLGLLRHSWED